MVSTLSYLQSPLGDPIALSLADTPKESNPCFSSSCQELYPSQIMKAQDPGKRTQWGRGARLLPAAFNTQAAEGCCLAPLCAVLSHSVVSDSSQPHGLQPAGLLCPWGFSRQEYWSGLPCPPPGDLPNPGIALQVDPLLSEPTGKTSLPQMSSVACWISSLQFQISSSSYNIRMYS